MIKPRIRAQAGYCYSSLLVLLSLNNNMLAL